DPVDDVLRDRLGERRAMRAIAEQRERVVVAMNLIDDERDEVADGGLCRHRALLAVLLRLLAELHARLDDARGGSTEDRARPRVERGRSRSAAPLAPPREPRVDLVEQAVERDGLRIAERRL